MADWPVIHQTSLDTKMLTDRLIATEIGAVLTYEDLSKHIGRNVQREARSCLSTARKRALKLKNAYYGVIRGIGIKHLPDEEVPEINHDYFGRVKRASRRHITRLAYGVKKFQEMSPEKQTQHNMGVCVAGALALGASRDALRRVEEKVTEAHSRIPVQQVIEAFRASGVEGSGAARRD